MPHASEFRTCRHVIHNLNAQLVVVPKYRRKVITERVFRILLEAMQGVCADFECDLRESRYEPDHVHLLVNFLPKVALSVLVNS